MHFPATMQRVHFRHQGYQIDCFRTSVDSNATHNKLFRVNRTSFIKVQQVKECLRLMGSKVQFLEIRLDEWRRQFVPELFKADFAAIITVDAGHQINKHVDKILLVLLAAAPQSGVHENASNPPTPFFKQAKGLKCDILIDDRNAHLTISALQTK
ncbi:unnamed protein product [Prorocentrum cordatum]|uniref:Uncharacterized protein n=1 Tax=Prorocentrum cordatum TaxID=2364126 RepID=A0ABN9UD27_9DINO|nr:unnamed protein product [Polarella glacialis]